MPWRASDAPRSTRKARTPAKRSKWAKVANSVLRASGSDAKAIRIANAALKKP
jgi:uncharacterized protein YdaT